MDFDIWSQVKHYWKMLKESFWHFQIYILWTISGSKACQKYLTSKKHFNFMLSACLHTETWHLQLHTSACIYMREPVDYIESIKMLIRVRSPAVSSCLIIKKNFVVDANRAFWTRAPCSLSVTKLISPETFHRSCDKINIYCIFINVSYCCLTFISYY